MKIDFLTETEYNNSKYLFWIYLDASCITQICLLIISTRSNIGFIKMLSCMTIVILYFLGGLYSVCTKIKPFIYGNNYDIKKIYNGKTQIII